LAVIVISIFAWSFLHHTLCIHRVKVSQKPPAAETATTRTGDGYAPLTAANPTSEPSLHEVRDLLLRTHRMLLHREEERRIQTLPTWPFETRAMTRIAAITLTGVVAVLGRAAVDYFLLR